MTVAPRRVLFLASGTRGDVEPAAALARAVSARGMQVLFATHEEFRPLAVDAGLACALLPANPTTILLRVCNALSLLGGPVAAALDTRRYVRRARPLYAAIADAARPLLAGCDSVVLGLPTIWLLPIAAACGARPVCAFLQPLTRSSLEPSAVAPRLPGVPALNRASHWALEQAVWLPWRSTLARWCRDAGLPPLELRGPFAEVYRRRLPVIYGFSESVVRRPADWPREHVITGYWRRAGSARPLPPPVARFLARHPRPVYVGFGSRAAPYGSLARGLAAALGAGGIPTLLHSDEPLPREDGCVISFAGEVDHAALFPALSLAVHHGGAGTFAAALHAGVPSVIVPSGVDSNYWQRRCLLLGVGPRAPALRTATPAAVAAAIDRCLADGSMGGRAQAVAARLAAERGAENAADHLERLMWGKSAAACAPRVASA